LRLGFTVSELVASPPRVIGARPVLSKH